MASATNWLSFSLSPIEMLRSSQSHQMLPSPVTASTAAAASQHSYFVDSFYGNDWENPRAEAIYTGDENHHQQSIGGYVDTLETHNYHHHHNHPTIPKLEDFLGCSDPSIVRYSDSHTETQEDSSLTQIYDHGGGVYFNHHHHHHHQDLKSIAAAAATVGFQAFPANSGSEVDDPMSISRAQSQIGCGGGDFVGHSLEMESVGSEMAVSQCLTEGLSLGFHNNNNENDNSSCCEKKAIVAVDQNMESSKRLADTFGQRTSIYRGVTRHRWTGRYEAHLWDNSCRREGQARKGRQVYLGGYDKEEKAARAYDLAALKYWGPTATTNFPISNYPKEVEEMKHVTKQEFIASLRRKSSGFSRGASIYRGVTRHHQQGRWQARIGRVAGNKDLYLGTFATEEEAAEAYDIAAIKFRGVNAVTNFEMSRYDVEAIANSALPVGGAAKRLKLSLESEQKPSLTQELHSQCSSNNNISFSTAIQPTIPSGIPFNTTTAELYHHHHQNLFHHLHSNSVSAPAMDSPGTASSIAAASQMMTLMPPHAEFFIWPHQSY